MHVFKITHEQQLKINQIFIKCDGQIKVDRHDRKAIKTIGATDKKRIPCLGCERSFNSYNKFQKVCETCKLNVKRRGYV